MPFDAVLLRAVREELVQRAVGARIDKVQQPERDALVLTLRAPGLDGGKLLLCASPNHARAHFTKMNMENPAQPPMFCMLLRKHLLGGRVVEIEQPPMERLLKLKLECGVHRNRTCSFFSASVLCDSCDNSCSKADSRNPSC